MGIEAVGAGSGAGSREVDRAARVLRWGAALCFIGHGAFGLITKEAWLPYFAFVGIGPDLAWAMMPIVGIVDIAVGLAVLVSPRPVFLLYMVGWAFWTAALRPLTGEPVWELLERAGNYGVPLALLVVSGALPLMWSRLGSARRGLGRPSPVELDRAALILRATTVLLLVGHGALAFLGKPLLLDHAAMLGFGADTVRLVGVFEMGLGVAVGLRPSAPLLGSILLWKVATELLYPLSGAPFWEFVERAGSYAAPAALLLLMRARAANLERGARAVPGRAAAARLTGVTGALLLVVTALPPTPLAAQEMRSPEDLVRALREGGYILAFRHTHTDRSHPDRDVAYDDRSTQRNLSERGVREAGEIGVAIRSLGIPIGEVVTSPFFRTLETARGAFERATVDEALSSRTRDSERRLALFSDPVPPGENRVLVSHQGVIRRMIPGLRGHPLEEGDIAVLDPRADGPARLIGLLPVSEWVVLVEGGLGNVGPGPGVSKPMSLLRPTR